MSLGIMLSVMAAVGYGAADFIGGLASRRVSHWTVALAGQLAGGAALLVVGLWLPGSVQVPDLAWALLAGVGSAVGTVSLYRGLARGRMGVVAPVSGVTAALVPVLVGVSLGERPTVLVWLGVLMAFPAIYLVSRDASRGRGRGPGGLLDGGVAGLGFGVLFVALAQIPESAGLLPLAANQGVGSLLTVAIARALRQPLLPSGQDARRGAVWGAAGGVLGTSGTVAFLQASHTTPLAVTGVLASLYPAVTVLLAAGLLGERLRAGQLLGLGVGGAAVCLVALG
jgi:drug/metabolite transporter (DMT)-like permease